mmetsp:Transcript_14257/g.40460  ORF Transcript_14257/g.40460 Transcript_14257/m.40460 type:complete len:242 (-) Transcript_14257:228-953(-)
MEAVRRNAWQRRARTSVEGSASSAPPRLGRLLPSLTRFPVFCFFQRVFETKYWKKKAILKQRFDKMYRHPILNKKLTRQRLGMVSPRHEKRPQRLPRPLCPSLVRRRTHTFGPLFRLCLVRRVGGLLPAGGEGDDESAQAWHKDSNCPSCGPGDQQHRDGEDAGDHGQGLAEGWQVQRGRPRHGPRNHWQDGRELARREPHSRRPHDLEHDHQDGELGHHLHRFWLELQLLRSERPGGQGS